MLALVSVLAVVTSAFAGQNVVGVLVHEGVDAGIYAQLDQASDAQRVFAAFGEMLVVRGGETGATLMIRCPSAESCIVGYSSPVASYRQNFDELIKSYSLTPTMAAELNGVWSKTQSASHESCSPMARDCRQFLVRQIATGDGRMELRCVVRINAAGESVGPNCSVRYNIRDTL